MKVISFVIFWLLGSGTVNTVVLAGFLTNSGRQILVS